MNFTKVVCVKTPIDYFWEMKVLLYAWDHFDEWVILQRLLDVENESIITNAGHLNSLAPDRPEWFMRYTI